MANKDNPSKGAKFEILAKDFFQRKRDVILKRPFSIDIGIGNIKKLHQFDLGSDKSNPKILVECKSHIWTEGDNVPSAKITIWNEAMYYFFVSPNEYQKILFVLKSVRNNETLAEYYIKRYKHLIPSGVEIWEYDQDADRVNYIYPAKVTI